VFISLGFAIAGLALLVFGTGRDRVGGLMLVLFFGVGCLSAFAMPLFTRTRGSAGARLGTARHRGRSVPALVFPISRAKLRLAALGSAGMSTAGVLMVVLGGSMLIVLAGLAAAGVFGSFVVLALLNEWNPASVALIRDGIFARGAVGSTFVRWEAIESAGVLEMGDTRMVAIRTTDPGAVDAGKIGGWLGRANRGLIGADATYSGLEVPEEQLAEAISYYCEHSGERERIGVELPPLSSNSAP
jgi:hypothetical protein